LGEEIIQHKTRLTLGVGVAEEDVFAVVGDVHAGDGVWGVRERGEGGLFGLLVELAEVVSDGVQ
jgi:hypothetical protein